MHFYSGQPGKVSSKESQNCLFSLKKLIVIISVAYPFGWNYHGFLYRTSIQRLTFKASNQVMMKTNKLPGMFCCTMMQ
jgi:hypothetical protein